MKHPTKLCLSSRARKRETKRMAQRNRKESKVWLRTRRGPWSLVGSCAMEKIRFCFGAKSARRSSIRDSKVSGGVVSFLLYGPTDMNV